MAAAKFTFDVEFRPEGDLVSSAARARQKKIYTVEEIDQLCTRAREQGMKSGEVRAIEAQAQQVARLAEALREVLATADAIARKVQSEAAMLALAAARKLAAAALQYAPADDVEVALRHALHQAMGEPRVAIHCSDQVAALLKPRLAEIAHDEGFEGRVAIGGDGLHGPGDCRIEWRGGGAERSGASIDAAIQDLIARYFSRPLEED